MAFNFEDPGVITIADKSISPIAIGHYDDLISNSSLTLDDSAARFGEKGLLVTDNDGGGSDVNLGCLGVVAGQHYSKFVLMDIFSFEFWITPLAMNLTTTAVNFFYIEDSSSGYRVYIGFETQPTEDGPKLILRFSLRDVGSGYIFNTYFDVAPFYIFELGQAIHFSLCSNGTRLKAFFNGVESWDEPWSSGIAEVSPDDAFFKMIVPNGENGDSLIGFDDFLFLNGYCLRTGDFTPPTSSMILT